MPPKRKDVEEKPTQRTVTLRIDEPWYEDLRRRAYEERENISELIRQALREKYGYQVTAHSPR